MIIYYNDQQGWFHPQRQLKFGNEILIPQSHVQNSYSFFIQEKTNKGGPLIGILTSGTESGKIYSDFKRWAKMQEELQRRGGVSFLFTPFGLHEDNIDGYIYLTDLKRWRKCKVPYPDVVYNRVPYRSHERNERVQRALQHMREKQVPVFNPCFFSKWQVYEALQTNSFLQSCLPDTCLLRTKQDLQTMLSRHRKLYIKRCDGARGKHLFTLEQLQEGIIVRQNVNESPAETTIESIWDVLSHSYVAQQAMNVDRHKNRPYDLRVLVQYLRNDFTVTGTGVRVAPKNGIATHVPNGGEIISLKELERPVHMKSIERIAKECGYTLMNTFGNVKEFSIDIGRGKDGHYFIFEVNAKPMIFDEPPIQKQAIENLLTIFEEEAGFSFSN